MIHFDNPSDGSSVPSALNLTAIVGGNKVEMFESSSLCFLVVGGVSTKTTLQIEFPSFCRSPVLKRGEVGRCTLQMKLGSSAKRTQEALIIRIAHKTINNEKFMLLLLVVNSNCYCGHLRIKNEAGLKSKFACLHFLMLCGKSLHPLGSCCRRLANISFWLRRLTLRP